MRLIDADELRQVLAVWTGYALSATEVAVMVEHAPTIDAVPVVRCKDCKNRMTEISNDKKTMYYCPFVDHYTVNDWYCADGERKDNEINLR